MKVLFVCPAQDGSGETITAIHFAEQLLAARHEVVFLATEFAHRFIVAALPVSTYPLSNQGADNTAMWHRAIAEFRPETIIFADYPLLFFPTGVAPLAQEPSWVDSLHELDARLVTLDHFGFAQGSRSLFLGPAHLGLGMLTLPALPESMQVMLPCPMHEPRPVEGRVGHAFRYWEVPIRLDEKVRAETRRRFLPEDNGLLVFHTVSNWAWRAAENYRIPFYHHMSTLLANWFADYGSPVTLISVNSGDLLRRCEDPNLQIINFGPCAKSEFESLLFSADLAITDNMLSISIGKAVCGFQTSAVIKNSYSVLELLERAEDGEREIVRAMERTRVGSVFPFAAFPTVTPDDVSEIGLYRDNRLSEGFLEVEIFGGSETREKIQALARDPVIKSEQRSRQEAYVDDLRQLPCGETVLRSLR